MATYYIDLYNGNDSNDGSSWANAWATITNGATAARIAPGDVIRISKTPDPVSIGNATWTNLSKTVTLATAQTLTIDNCESEWTAANGASVARGTSRKEGSYCAYFSLPSETINTKYAYHTLSSIDLSSYQKISFWIRNNVYSLVQYNYKLCLCSDTDGDVIVDTFEIPAIASKDYYLPLTLARTGGGNLGSSIQSIALYTGSTVVTTTLKTFMVDNIIACTSTGLNLQSLISKNGNAQGGDEGFYGIQSIDGTTVLLDNSTNTNSNVGKGYTTIGTSPETVTTYIRETFKNELGTSGSQGGNVINDSGTFGNNIQFQGGYNTSTGEQTGETFFDGSNGLGAGIYFGGKSYVTINLLSAVRFNYGIYLSTAHNNTFTTLSNINNNTNNSIYLNTADNNIFESLTNGNNNGDDALYLSTAHNNIFNNIGRLNNNLGSSITFLSSNDNVFKSIAEIYNNQTQGIYLSGYDNKLKVSNIIESTGISIQSGVNYVINSTFTATTEVSCSSYPSDLFLWSLNHDNTLNNHWGFTYAATVNWQTSTVHGTEPGAWKTSIAGTSRNTRYPVKLKIAEVAFSADSLVTVTAWVKKDHATNVGCRLVTYANVSSVNINEQSDTKANDTDWEQLSISFTPEEAGVQEIYLESWYVAGISNTYVGTVTVAQV